MKAEEIKTKTPDELKKLLIDLRKDQFNLRFQRTQGTLENTAELRKVRRTIARVKTFLNPVAVQPGKTPSPTTKAKTTKKESPAKETAKKKDTTKATKGTKKDNAKKEEKAA